MAKSIDPLLDSARGHVAATMTVLSEATKANTSAQTALAAALGRLDEAKSRFTAAQDAYREDQSSSNAKAIRTAREALELVELECDRPRATAAEADRALSAAQNAVAGAEEEVRRLERDATIAEFRTKSSVERYRAATDVLFASLLGSYKAMLQAAEGIDAAWNLARESAQTLVEIGVENPPEPLSPQHLLSGIALALATEDPFVAVACLDTNVPVVAMPLRQADNSLNLRAIITAPVIENFTRRYSMQPPPPVDVLSRLRRILAVNDPDAEWGIINREDRASTKPVVPSSIDDLRRQVVHVQTFDDESPESGGDGGDCETATGEAHGRKSRSEMQAEMSARVQVSLEDIRAQRNG